MAINSFTLQGRLCADPEVRFFESGSVVVEFTLAWDKTYGDRKSVLFMKCKLWGKSAENFASFFRKGNEALVEGEIETNKWQDKTTGQNRSEQVLNVSRWHFMTGLPRNSPEPTTQAQKGPTNQASTSAPSAAQPSYLDIPF